MMASCSSSDLREKLILETSKTERTVPSFKITISSRISAISRNVLVAGPGFGFANFLDCIVGKLVAAGFSLRWVTFAQAKACGYRYYSSGTYTPPVLTTSVSSLKRELERGAL